MITGIHRWPSFEKKTTKKTVCVVWYTIFHKILCGILPYSGQYLTIQFCYIPSEVTAFWWGWSRAANSCRSLLRIIRSKYLQQNRVSVYHNWKQTVVWWIHPISTYEFIGNISKIHDTNVQSHWKLQLIPWNYANNKKDYSYQHTILLFPIFFRLIFANFICIFYSCFNFFIQYSSLLSVKQNVT